MNGESARPPANWLRCLALIGSDGTLKATGVVFPDSVIVVHWAHGTTSIYTNADEVAKAVVDNHCFITSTEIEIPLCQPPKPTKTQD